MNHVEILAPVGGTQQLFAAVRSGADAVYLGARGFNARRNAENFDTLGLSDAVKYCHARNVRVHVTLNTLVLDSEFSELLDTLSEIAESGADAVIVQDLAVARLVRACCPTLPMHASTQMTIHNLAGAKQLEALGFQRVVLSRELTLPEIRQIAEQTKLETEVFVHGALCMSMSGMCYLSSVLGQRSGNRGLCAQPCRLDFKCRGRSFALSLKDMSYVEKIEQLVTAGVTSLKIEGRMKRPEYVAAAVSACRDTLSGKQPDLESLEAVFSRSGFTDGYLTGKRTLQMFGTRTKEDVQASAAVFGKLSGLYRAERACVPVSMRFSLHGGETAALSVSDGTREVSVSGEPAEDARQTPTDFELAKKVLEKTGGTPFFLEKLECDIGKGLFCPPSSLGAMRREATEQLLLLRSVGTPHAFSRVLPESPKKSPAAVSVLRVRGERWEQLCCLEADRYILPVGEIETHPECIGRFGDRLLCELPALIFPQDEELLLQRLQKLKTQGLVWALCENIGAIGIAKRAGLQLCGGSGLNVLNTLALEEYGRLGIREMTLSFELSRSAIGKLSGSLPRGILCYGYLPLMRFRTCPSQNCKECTGSFSITDRLSKTFPVLCGENRRYGTLLNSVPLYCAESWGVDFKTAYFTVESPERCAEIVSMLQNRLPMRDPHTNGLYDKTLA